MAQTTTKNPLARELARIGKTQSDLIRASGGVLAQSQMSGLTKDLTPGDRGKRPTSPQPTTRDCVNRALAKLGGKPISDRQWDAFGKAVSADRAPFDRRKNGLGARFKRRDEATPPAA